MHLAQHMHFPRHIHRAVAQIPGRSNWNAWRCDTVVPALKKRISLCMRGHVCERASACRISSCCYCIGHFSFHIPYFIACPFTASTNSLRVTASLATLSAMKLICTCMSGLSVARGISSNRQIGHGPSSTWIGYAEVWMCWCLDVMSQSFES